MKLKFRTLPFCSVVFLACSAAALCAQEKKESVPGRDKLLAARLSWYDSFCSGDTEQMSKIEDKDFLVISPRGIQSKEEQLRGIRKRVEEQQWFPKGSTHATEDLKVRLYGKSAIVTGQGWVKFPEATEPPKEKYYISEAWVNQDGQWRVVHLHFHAVEKP